MAGAAPCLPCLAVRASNPARTLAAFLISWFH